MKRREFIALLGGAAATALAARGARPAGRADAAHRRAAARSRGRPGISGPPRSVPAGAARVGLDHRPQPTDRHPLGYTECRRHSPHMRRNWSRSRLTSFWSMASRPWGAMLQATRTVPIVFPVAIDPVGAGFVDSLARPGGNVTGFMSFEYSLAGKWLELLKQIAPGVTRAAVLRDPIQVGRHQPVCRHPGHGAVAQGGGEPDQPARRRRDRAYRRGLRAQSEWRSDRDGGPASASPSDR